MEPYPASTTFAVPPADVAQYYGNPEAAKIVVHEQEQIAGIGTTFWVMSKTVTETVQYHGDAFGIVAPTQPLTVTPSFSVTLILPIHFPPSGLDYVLYPVKAADRWGYEQYPQPTLEVETWNPPDLRTDPMIGLPLEVQQDLAFYKMGAGLYILLVEASWQDLGTVDFGFLLNVINE